MNKKSNGLMTGQEDESESQARAFEGLDDLSRNFYNSLTAIAWNPWDKVLIGDDSSNTIGGTGKRDLIIGLGGNDRLRGLDGNDALIGGAGNDTLVGGKGNDTLDGGLGNDVIYLGGSDKYKEAPEFSKKDKDTVLVSLVEVKSNDTVYGFEAGDIFKICDLDKSKIVKFSLSETSSYFRIGFIDSANRENGAVYFMGVDVAKINSGGTGTRDYVIGTNSEKVVNDFFVSLFAGNR